MIGVIVYGFRIIGLAPFSVQKIRKPTKNSRSSSCTTVFRFSRVGLTYNIILLILNLVLSALAIPLLFSAGTYPYSSSITKAVDVMLGILRTSTDCVIIIFWAFKQELAASIMNRLVEVDSLLRGMKNHRSSGKTSIIFFVVQIISDACLWVIFWATEVAYIRSLLDFFMFNVPIFLTHCFVVEYSIVVGLLAREFEKLNTSLLNFDEVSQCSIHTPLSIEFLADLHRLPTQSQLPTLKSLQSIRTTLSDVSQDVADFFSFPMLLVVACFSLTLVYNFYYLITPLVIPSADVIIPAHVNLAAWILVCVHPLGALCFNITETLKKAKRTGVIVHRLLAKSRREEIRRELHVFCLQLIHEELSFTAYGFFPLDFTLIQSIFAATATYLVIIIQFMQSAANTSNVI